MTKSVALMQAAYDQIASDYDSQSEHLRDQQRRLTAALALSPGLRCADLGAGTGLETVEMLWKVTPGEVVAVDCSPGMLAAARRRAEAAGLALTTLEQEAEAFLHGSADASFDVLSLRFCLGYLDWATVLPTLGRMLRPGGRVGILANLSSSAQQAYGTYRKMVSDLGLPDVPVTAPESREQIERLLTDGGLEVTDSWTHTFRLWFASGAEMSRWLRASGLATHAALTALPTAVVDALFGSFADRLEAHREADGLPLDFAVAGVVAMRR
ncbi:MAG: methyltransferase domain-containing protein [Polyangiales bacterium]